MYREHKPGPIIALLMNRVIALDRQTGEIVFDRRARGSELLVTRDAIFVAASDVLTCFSYPEGVRVFESPLPAHATTSMHRVGDTIVLKGSGEISCVSMSDGALLWHNKLKGYGTGSMSIAIPG